MGQERVEQGAGAGAPQTRSLSRPNFTQRANRRFPFVLAALLVLNLGQLLMSGLSGWAMVRAFVGSAYGTVVAAAILTLLIAMLPGKQRAADQTPAPVPPLGTGR